MSPLESDMRARAEATLRAAERLARELQAAERERDELRRTLDTGFVEVRDRMQAAEAKLTAIRELCDAYDFDTDNIEPAQLRRILDGSET